MHDEIESYDCKYRGVYKCLHPKHVGFCGEWRQFLMDCYKRIDIIEEN